jgi:hypothetical protein
MNTTKVILPKDMKICLDKLKKTIPDATVSKIHPVIPVTRNPPDQEKPNRIPSFLYFAGVRPVMWLNIRVK